jgi:serine/threonine-protein kinase PRP4
MTDDSAHSNDVNSYKSQPKRSLSPDEGEIVDEVKRRRDSRSPPVNHDGDGRRHRVVYEGDYSNRGNRYRGRGSYRGRDYHDARGYRDSDPRWEPRRHQHREEYRYSSHSRDSSRSRQPSATDTPRDRDRSISSERRPTPRARDTSHPPSLRRSRSPSPRFRQVQFSADAKPPPPYFPIKSKLIYSEHERVPIPEPVDEDALIEVRRKKREAILAKYQGQSRPSLVDNLKLQSTEASPAPASPAVRLGILCL